MKSGWNHVYKMVPLFSMKKMGKNIGLGEKKYKNYILDGHDI